MRTLTAIVMALALTVTAQAQQTAYPAPQSQTIKKALTYKQAYAKAQAGDKPLLVLVSADWCPPCRQMKATTIPELMNNKTLSKYHFAMVDFDKQRSIAQELIKGDKVQLPQLVMFKKKDGKWLRHRLKGIASTQQVASWASQANTVHLASGNPNSVEKK